eukprot:CAMPEP_0177777962 /NCGR_PEP_ID=MMETSP0491_2-20121128/15673_1 /TAXON_ID=63592 /ORGANISM="Tetraselmis chuii, Strain PLY429" /LENGTH=185 /DNA_ID=CAMNT_0019297149 /DNA_START=218 /DNA_END=773 /DNA_ORIENTATION=-
MKSTVLMSSTCPHTVCPFPHSGCGPTAMKNAGPSPIKHTIPLSPALPLEEGVGGAGAAKLVDGPLGRDFLGAVKVWSALQRRWLRRLCQHCAACVGRPVGSHFDGDAAVLCRQLQSFAVAAGFRRVVRLGLAVKSVAASMARPGAGGVHVAGFAVALSVGRPFLARAVSVSALITYEPPQSRRLW